MSTISFILLLILASPVLSEQNYKIVGGVRTDITKFPFLLSLRYYSFHVCGASAISKIWVVSAGHCLDSRYPPHVITLRVGSTRRLSGGTIVKIKEYFLHPRYDKNSMTFDVAVIKMLNNLPVNSFALLPRSSFSLPTATRVQTVGWGATESGALSDELMKVTIPIVSDGKCKSAWRQYYTATSLCAGRLNKDSCAGDSGGPLVFLTNILVGIVSFGPENCGSLVPGVYTKVSYPPILNFITNTTGIF